MNLTNKRKLLIIIVVITALFFGYKACTNEAVAPAETSTVDTTKVITAKDSLKKDSTQTIIDTIVKLK